MKILISLILMFSLSTGILNAAEKKKDDSPMKESTFSGLKLRSIGPAIASGRIIDFAINPENKNEFFVAVASGGVWKTTNKGITFKPVFDNQGSYSIGCVVYDPSNPHTVWVGSGENNSQRSVSYGDGVYKSTDDGKTWKNMGLKNSEHIGKIVIDPRNSNDVYVAAQGPLWGPGGDRGLYKSTDGGDTWEKSLDISENTGVSDLVMDPRNPDVLYCTSYQRRRHVWTLINGGPESAVYKSEDAGKNWHKLTNGLPGGELGRIGLGISPVNPDVLYALIEAHGEKGGFFRSTNRGGSWAKTGPYKSVSAQYYQELVCDPIDVDKVYFLDTYLQVTDDGGKTTKHVGNRYRHVDDHALWIDPDNTDYLLVGGDGGMYETYDAGSSWRYFPNLPITQYYRVGIDNAKPFYNIYGGTQDNNSYGGPSQTINSGGITNDDWFKVVGGDGFQARIDPKDPNIVYAQPQYGFLVRFDRKSGEMVFIQPQPESGEAYTWNWDSPLIISPHSNTRLYFAANKLFRSDDRGDSWKVISPDLTRQIDRNTLEVMGKVWPPEAVAKNASTSIYGNIVSLTESPKQEDLVYVGTDDGLVQVTEDAGNTWTKYGTFPGVPERTYVSDLHASPNDANVIYAAFDNHKMADFKPYILKSTDKGKTWKSISSNLPENGPVYSILEDHVNPNLLFAGTEFGVFFSINGGEKWFQLKSGIPTIAVKDMEIQRRENDLVLATFGRGFYVLDNYEPLREVSEEILDKDVHIFKIKDALIFKKDDSKSKQNYGITHFRADNPKYGAVFTYYVKENEKTLKQKRNEAGKKDKNDKNQDNKSYKYPSFEELMAEDLEEGAYLIFTIKDAKGNFVRKLTAPVSKGIHRINWDLSYSDPSPVSERSNPNKNSGLPALPGKYFVAIDKSVNGKISKFADPVSFNIKPLNNKTLPAKSPEYVAKFQEKAFKLHQAISSSNKILADLNKRVMLIKKSLMQTPEAPHELLEKARELELELKEISVTMNGNPSISKRNAEQPPSINNRLQLMLWASISSSSDITKTAEKGYKIISEEFAVVLEKLRKINFDEIKALEDKMQEMESPWTPGRFPDWKAE